MSLDKMVGRLKARLGLDNSEFRQGLRQSKGELDRFSGGLAQTATRIRAALGFTVAGVGIQQLVSRTRQAVRAVADLGDQAKRAGTSVETFQRWGAVAEQNRIGIDQMADGLRELQIRTDEFVTTGGGAAAEAFRRLGFNADQLKDKLKDPSELMLEIIGRLQHLDRAAQIRITDEIFGGSAGERFVELLGRGEAGIRRTMRETRVLTDEQVRAASELDRKYTALANNMATAWKSVAVSVAEAVSGMATLGPTIDDILKDEARARAILGSEVYERLVADREAASGAEESVQDLSLAYEELNRSIQAVVNQVGGDMGYLWDQAQGGADDLVGSINDVLSEMEQVKSDMQAGKITADEFRDGLKAATDEAQRLLAEANAIDGVDMSSAISAVDGLAEAMKRAFQWATSVRTALPGATKPFDDRGQAISEHEAGKPENSSPLAPRSSVAPRRAPAMTHELGGAGGSDGGGGGGSGSKVEGYARAIAETRAEILRLTAESAELLAVANAGTEIGNSFDYARRRAELVASAMEEGLEITPALRAEIDQLALSYATASDAAEEAAARLKEIEAAVERGEDAFEGLFGAILDGSDAAKQALADLLVQMAKVQFQKGMLGLLGSTSWGSKLIEGAGAMLGSNANGTSNWRGGLTELNERGGEILDLPKGTRIIPHDISRRMADRAGGASEVRITPSPLFEAQVVKSARGEAVRAAKAESASLRAQIPALMADAQRRRG